MTLEDIKVKARKILFGKNPNDSLPVVSKNFNDLVDYISELEETVNTLTGGTTAIVAVNDLDPVISQINPPPAAPTSGDRYLISTTPTGSWVGNANNIAEWDGAAWQYTTAVLDDVVYITNTLTTKRFNGTSWVAYSGTAALVGGNSVAGTMTIGNNLGAQLNLKINGISRFAIAAGGYLRQAAPAYIGSNITTNAHASSILELASTTKGFLAPRMTTAQKNAIATPAAGLLVYDTDLDGYYYYEGGWLPLGGSSTPTDITYGGLFALYNAGTMVPGTFYNIINRADNGIVVQAVSASELALNATGIFLNPDFQSVGDYSDVFAETGITYTSTQGVWTAAGEAGYANGMIVFYFRSHWQVIDDLSFDGNSPDSNPTAYQVLQKTTSNFGYIREADYIEYSLVADAFLRRKCKRENDIIGAVNIDVFQWGRDVVSNNIASGIANSGLNCQNSLCTSISDNYIGQGISVDLNDIGMTNTWDRNKLYNGAKYNVTTIGVSFTGTTGEFNGNTLTPTEDIIFDSAINSFGSYEGQVLSKLGSTFEIIFEDTGLTAIDLGTAQTYAGIVNIQQAAAGTSAITIVDLLNFPIDRPVLVRPRSYSSGGGDLTATFTHGTGADDPHCSGGVDAVLLGDNGDFIQFTRRETKVSSGVYRIYQTGGETY